MKLYVASPFDRCEVKHSGRRHESAAAAAAAQQYPLPRPGSRRVNYVCALLLTLSSISYSQPVTIVVDHDTISVRFFQNFTCTSHTRKRCRILPSQRGRCL